jgi:hypothetical protein
MEAGISGIMAHRYQLAKDHKGRFSLPSSESYARPTNTADRRISKPKRHTANETPGTLKSLFERIFFTGISGLINQSC